MTHRSPIGIVEVTLSSSSIRAVSRLAKARARASLQASTSTCSSNRTADDNARHCMQVEAASISERVETIEAVISSPASKRKVKGRDQTRAKRFGRKDWRASTIHAVRQALMKQLETARIQRDWQYGRKTMQESTAHVHAHDIIDLNLFNAALSVAAASGECQGALDVMATMRRSGIRPNSLSYAGAMMACASGGSCERVATLLGKMRTEGISADDADAFTAIMETCRDMGEWKLALDVLQMIEESATIAPDCRTLKLAILACADGGYWQQAIAYLRKMQTREQPPDASVYATVISTCGRARQWEQALNLLKEMGTEKGTTSPDAAVYEAVVRACSRGGQLNQVLSLLRELRAPGCAAKPTVNIYNAAIWTLTKGPSPTC